MSASTDVAQKIAFTIHPSGAEAGSLTVADAMRQVLDLVEVLDRFDAAEDEDARIVWRLESASTNSPFTVVAGAVAADPGISVALEANRVTGAFSDAIRSLLEESKKPDIIDEACGRILERVFKRNLNGVGRTDIGFPDAESATLFIVPRSAQKALITLERAELDQEAEEQNLSRDEFGAREGEVVGLVRYYNAPALILRDRLTGERIPVVLKTGLAKRIGPEHAWSEAWEGRRVSVTGSHHYDAAGTLRKIDAEEIEVVSPRPVHRIDLEGIDLLCGRSVSQHLAAVWGDDA